MGARAWQVERERQRDALMRVIDNTEDLCALCEDFSRAPYVTLDTEFMRERTYWPIFCLAQIARPLRPGEAPERAATIIDPLAESIDLSPLFTLLADKGTVKVFHAARQDIEIFHHLGNLTPTPLYDTQIAAMVCGYGEQVGYETLVRRIARRSLDKSSRFTDWSRRPLHDKQCAYALADVTHLRTIYEVLDEEIRREKRESWVREELDNLVASEGYATEPGTAWRRLRLRNRDPRTLAAAKTLATWRENLAQRLNVPRGHMMRDEALIEIAIARPKNREALSECRLYRGGLKREDREGLFAALREAESLPDSEIPVIEKRVALGAREEGLVQILKPLLRICAAAHRVAPRLIASSVDLETIATEEAPDVPALKGWRLAIFGNVALRLKRGEIALSASEKGVEIVEMPRQSGQAQTVRTV